MNKRVCSNGMYIIINIIIKIIIQEYYKNNTSNNVHVYLFSREKHDRFPCKELILIYFVPTEQYI